MFKTILNDIAQNDKLLSKVKKQYENQKLKTKKINYQK